jgi:hypothetical protein
LTCSLRKAIDLVRGGCFVYRLRTKHEIIMSEVIASPVGSWIPALILLFALVAQWLCRSQHTIAIRLRRWFGIHKVSWKRKLGFRDAGRYESGAVGLGASKSVRRQG